MTVSERENARRTETLRIQLLNEIRRRKVLKWNAVKEEAPAPVKTFEEKYKTWHTYLSFGKSAIRLLACAGCVASIQIGRIDLSIIILAAGFAVAEFIGIIEEL